MFTIRESELQDMLGLRDRDELRSIRREMLHENVDFVIKSKAIFYSEQAAQKIAARLEALPFNLAKIALTQKNALPLPTPPASEKIAPSPAHRPQSASQHAILTVVRAFPNGNRNVLQCSMPGREGAVYVRVNPEKLDRFVPKMQLLGRDDGHGTFQFAGNPAEIQNPPQVPRYPRQRGRW